MEKRARIFELARMQNNNSSQIDRIQKMTENKESRIHLLPSCTTRLINNCIHHNQESVQFSSVAQLCQTLCDPMNRSMPGHPLSITNSWSLLKLMSFESVMLSNHLILCHPLLLLRSIVPSIRVFSNESVLRIRWSKYSSFSFNISPSNEYSGLISFRMDWLDLLAVQGTLKSLL